MRGSTTVQVYSFDFSKQYHLLLNGQVERRLQASIIDVASIWYTAWVDAGKPDLNTTFGRFEKKIFKLEKAFYRDNMLIQNHLLRALLPNNKIISKI